MDEDVTEHRGKNVLEFTLSRSDKVVVPFRQKSKAGRDGCSVQWRADGAFQYYDGAEGRFIVTDEKFPDEAIKVMIVSDGLHHSVYVDEKLVLENIQNRGGEQGTCYLRVWLESEACELKFDNIRLFEAYLLSEDRVEADYDVLTEQTLVQDDDPAYQYGKVSQNLVLPTKGVNGSNITWATSNDNLIKTYSKIGRI